MQKRERGKISTYTSSTMFISCLNVGMILHIFIHHNTVATTTDFQKAEQYRPPSLTSDILSSTRLIPQIDFPPPTLFTIYDEKTCTSCGELFAVVRHSKTPQSIYAHL